MEPLARPTAGSHSSFVYKRNENKDKRVEIMILYRVMVFRIDEESVILNKGTGETETLQQHLQKIPSMYP